MTVSRSRGVTVVGVEGHLVDVEADISRGLPGLSIVGLADTAVTEARDRVRSAILNSGHEWPDRRVTIGLSPAWLPKRGSGLDLAVASALLHAVRAFPASALAGTVLIGELGLDGTVRSVRGVVTMAVSARQQGVQRLIVPAGNHGEASLVSGIEVVGVASLGHLVEVLLGRAKGCGAGSIPAAPEPDPPDLSEVRGQYEARIALEVAAAGGHHMAMIGSPGVGKTMLAERLVGLLPDLDDASSLEVTSIRSVSGRPLQGLVRRPPFEAPHHSASTAAIIGSGAGSTPRPGLVTLAHRGVLFLDEATEFRRDVLDSLRQPLESGCVSIARAAFTTVLPARVQLVMAANPCPCGNVGADCICGSLPRRRYLSRLSGPLMDRVDLRLTLSRPTAAELGDPFPAESTRAVAARVLAARERAVARMSGSGWSGNAAVPGPVIRREWPMDDRVSESLAGSVTAGRLTMRGADRVLRIAWTLADLAEVARPRMHELGMALRLRDFSGAP